MSAFRAVVIGTGVAGAATAFALSRRGASVIMVDAASTGQATAAGAGIIQPWSSAVDGEFYSLYARGADYYPTLIGQLAELGVDDIGYRMSGALIVNADLAKLDEVFDRVTSRAPAAPLIGQLSRLDNRQARELFPPLGPDLDGLFISGGARVDGRTLRDGLLEGARRLGATTRLGTATLQRTPGGFRMSVDGDILEADAVVVAAGAWTNTVLAGVGARLPVEPQRGQITHLRFEGVDTRMWPSVHPISSHYMVAFDDSRVAIGATRETGSGFDPRVTAAGQKQILDNALSIAPGLGEATFIETRVGLRPLSSHTMPSVEPVAGHPGLFVNAGFGAAGLTMGPVVGDMLAETILAA